MEKLLEQFKLLCLEERNILKSHGIDSEITPIYDQKKELFDKISENFNKDLLTDSEKKLVNLIKKIQSESEMLYEDILSDTQKVIQKLKINKNNLNRYKINVDSSAFIDHSG